MEERKEFKEEKNINSLTNVTNNIMQDEIKLLPLNQCIIIPHDELTFKIIFLGASGTGKSSIIKRIFGETVGSRYIKTLCCDIRTKKLKFKEKMLKLKFFEIGNVDLIANLPVFIEYFKIVHACVYVIDVNESSSLSYVEKLASENIYSFELINYLLLHKSDVNKIERDETIITNRVNNLTKSEKSNFKTIFHTSIEDIDSIQNFFNTMMGDLIEFYEHPDQRKIYLEKNKLDNANLFFKYKTSDKKKKCFNC